MFKTCHLLAALLASLTLLPQPASAQEGCAAALAADLDDNGSVDAGDIGMLLLLFGPVDPCCDLNCDDGDPNTVDSCLNGVCQHFNPCDDGFPCTIDTLDPKTGLCSNTLRDCDDGNGCTDDSCNPTTGQCQFTPRQGSACSDGNACTFGDACVNGTCVGIPRNCNDNNPCTIDTCDPAVGCINTPIAGCVTLAQPSRMTALARCADTVCEIMPSCCSTDWDAVCGSLATTVDACGDAAAVQATLERADANQAAAAEIAAIDKARVRSDRSMPADGR